MRADPQELVAHAPGEKRRGGIPLCIIQASAARCMKGRAGVGGVKEHVGVENQQLLFFHDSVECVTVVNVDQMPAAVPRWKRRQGLGPFLCGVGRKHATESGLDQSRHRGPPPGSLLPQALHDRIINIEGRLHMGSHTIPQKVVFETVAEEVFRHYGRVWKPRTAKVNRSYLRNQILPWFRNRPVSDITRSEVQRWFASLHATPAAANRSLPVLSVILQQAEIHGHRRDDTNPCTGLRRYREQGRMRFLTVDEIRRLGTAVTGQEASMPLPAAAVHLLLLTGCRQGEVRTLRWQDYREGHLFLRDSKTGPRTVWLSSASRSVLDRLPRTSSWVFPSLKNDGPLSAETLHRCWRALRTAAGLDDVRLHDLRHSYASFALRQGETLLTIGRLLGHRDPATTLKYTHFADGLLREAVETVGFALEVA